MWEDEDTDPNGSEDYHVYPMHKGKEVKDWFVPRKGKSFRSISDDDWESIVEQAHEYYKAGHKYGPDWMVSYLANLHYFRHIGRNRDRQWCHSCGEGPLRGEELIPCQYVAKGCKNCTHLDYECSANPHEEDALPTDPALTAWWVCWECHFKKPGKAADIAEKKFQHRLKDYWKSYPHLLPARGDRRQMGRPRPNTARKSAKKAAKSAQHPAVTAKKIVKSTRQPTTRAGGDRSRNGSVSSNTRLSSRREHANAGNRPTGTWRAKHRRGY